MIFHRYESNLLDEYIFEGYRRLYAVSVDKDGNIPNFDILYAQAKTNSNHQLVIEYEEYYSPHDLQTKIIDDLVNESYITPRGAIRKLKEHDKTSVKISVTLGCSPFSSKVRFAERHKEFDKEKEKFD